MADDSLIDPALREEGADNGSNNDGAWGCPSPHNMDPAADTNADSGTSASPHTVGTGGTPAPNQASQSAQAPQLGHGQLGQYSAYGTHGFSVPTQGQAIGYQQGLQGTLGSQNMTQHGYGAPYGGTNFGSWGMPLVPSMMAQGQASRTARFVPGTRLQPHGYQQQQQYHGYGAQAQSAQQWPAQQPLALENAAPFAGNQAFTPTQLGQLRDIMTSLVQTGGHSIANIRSDEEGGFGPLQVRQIREIAGTLPRPQQPATQHRQPARSPSAPGGLGTFDSAGKTEQGQGIKALRHTPFEVRLSDDLPGPERRVREALLRAVEDAPLRDPNFRAVPKGTVTARRSDTVGPLRTDMSAGERKAREKEANRISADRKRRREAQHRDDVVNGLAAEEAEKLFWKGTAVARGANIDAYDQIPADLKRRMQVDTISTLDQIGLKKAKQEAKKQTTAAAAPMGASQKRAPPATEDAEADGDHEQAKRAKRAKKPRGPSGPDGDGGSGAAGGLVGGQMVGVGGGLNMDGPVGG